jgi:hypothetical protein
VLEGFAESLRHKAIDIRIRKDLYDRNSEAKGIYVKRITRALYKNHAIIHALPYNCPPFSLTIVTDLSCPPLRRCMAQFSELKIKGSRTWLTFPHRCDHLQRFHPARLAMPRGRSSRTKQLAIPVKCQFNTNPCQ